MQQAGMMKKKGRKKSKKAASIEAARVEAAAREAALEAEVKAKQEEAVAREANLLMRESAVEEREKAAALLEAEVASRASAVEAEVAAKSRSAIAAAEVRASQVEARCLEREAAVQAREAALATAEGDFRVRKIEVESRELALGEHFVGNIAEKLNAMIVAQTSERDALMGREMGLDAREKQLDAREARLDARDAETEKKSADADDEVAEKRKEADALNAKAEFAARQRIRRRIHESEAVVESHRAECEVRSRKIAAREEEIARRNRELLRLSRKVRNQQAAMDAQLKALKQNDTSAAAAVVLDRPKSPLDGFYRPSAAPFLPGTELPASPGAPHASDQHLKTLLDRIETMKAELVVEMRGAGHASPGEEEENDDGDPTRPFAGRNLPARPKSAVGRHDKPSAVGYRPQSARTPRRVVASTAPESTAPEYDEWACAPAPAVDVPALAIQGRPFQADDDELY